MEEEKKYSVDAAHRYFGVEFNNRVFALEAKEKLSEQEALEIVNAAHSSLLHWQQFSGHKLVNTQRGLYMIAKAYVKIQDKLKALQFAQKCYELTQANKSEMMDFDIFYTNEMMARAAALNGNLDLFNTHYIKAQDQLANIKNPEDLKWAKKDFESGNWFGMA